MPTCEDIREEFSALLDEELDPETRDTIEAHLCTCSECLRELHTLKRTSDLYRAQPRVRAPEDFQEQVMRALEPGRRGAYFSQLLRPGPLLALAAALLLVSSLGYLQWRTQDTAPFMVSFGTAPEMEQAAAPDAHMEAESMTAMRLDEAPTEMALEEPEASEGSGADAAASRAMPEGIQARAFALESAQPEPPSPPAAMPLRKGQGPETVAPASPATSASGALEALPQSTSERPGGGAQGFADPAPMPETRVGDRLFHFREKIWTQSSYAGEAVTILAPDSALFSTLVEKDSTLSGLTALEPVVIFRVEEAWYRLQAASAQH